MNLPQFHKRGLEGVGDALAYFLTLFPCWFLAKWGSPKLALVWLIALVAQIAIVYLLKFIFNSTSWGTRPEGDGLAFPSAHTSNSFFGAMWMFTAAAFPGDLSRILISILWVILAAIVAYSRVIAMRHHVRDVIGGAILGMAVAFLALQF